MIILSIDPGLVNMGVAIFDTLKNKFLFVDKVSLANRESDLKGEEELLYRCWKALFSDSRIQSYIKQIDVVLVEHQMKRRYVIVKYILITISFMLKKEIHVLSPTIVKTMFGTSRGEYLANKNAAIQMATFLWSGILNKVSKAKQDDVSDAMLQAYYWGITHDSNLQLSPSAKEFIAEMKTQKPKRKTKTGKTTRKKRKQYPSKRPKNTKKRKITT